MSNPFWKLILWVLGYAALFLIVLSGLPRFTDVEFIEIVTAMNSIGILVAICVGGVFAALFLCNIPKLAKIRL